MSVAQQLKWFMPVATMSIYGLSSPQATAQNACGWASFPEDGPDNRTGAEMVYDSARHRVLLFGGSKIVGQDNEWPTDLWAWDGEEWTLADDGLDIAPEGRQGLSMAYDSHRDEIVLFGGGRGDINTFYPETWVWDCSEMMWIEVDDGSGSPTPRWSGEMVFDSTMGDAVLFGGTPDANSLLGDTWTWDGNGWTQMAPTHSPSARAIFDMSYDVRRGVIVLFGGFDDPPDCGESCRTNDTWEWSGATSDWMLVHDGTGSDVPGRRNGHAMAYDMARGVTVMFGGWNGQGHQYPETWEWDGAAWKQRAAFGPQPRTGHAMAYDIAHGNTVLYGGQDVDGTRYVETWTWDGTILGDFNGDGVKDTRDVLAFLNAWTDTCP